MAFAAFFYLDIHILLTVVSSGVRSEYKLTLDIYFLIFDRRVKP